MTTTPKNPPFGITGIAHWALKVENFDRSLTFYRDQLGFPEMMRIHHDDGQLMLVYLRVTDTQFLEIFPRGKGGAGPPDDANCVHHICLQVTNVAATAEALRAKGVTLWREPKLGLDGNNQCWITDPDGHRIEFMQMLPDSMQERAIARLKGV